MSTMNDQRWKIVVFFISSCKQQCFQEAVLCEHVFLWKTFVWTCYFWVCIIAPLVGWLYCWQNLNQVLISVPVAVWCVEMAWQSVDLLILIFHFSGAPSTSFWRFIKILFQNGFLATGWGVTRPWKWIYRGGWGGDPPLQIHFQGWIAYPLLQTTIFSCEK